MRQTALALVTETRQHLLYRLRHRAQQRGRVGGHFKTHVLELLHIEYRALEAVAFAVHITHVAFNLFGHALAFLNRVGKQLHRVGAGLDHHVGADHAFLKAMGFHRVGAAHDHEIRIAARGHRVLDFHHQFLARHRVLDALMVMHALGEYLVFDMQARRARLLDFAHAAHHVQRLAVTRAAIHDHRNFHRVADHARGVGQFGQCNQRFAGRVTYAQLITADMHGLHAHRFAHARGVRIPDAQHVNKAGAVQHITHFFNAGM